MVASRAAAVPGFLLLAVAALSCAPQEGGTPVAEPPVSATSNYGFAHEGLGVYKVVRLREQERLDELVTQAQDELQIIESLTLWTRRQFEPGIPDPYPLSNGLDILADIRSGKTGGFCGQYAYLLADALKSYGFFDVRYVETWADETNSHFLVEVWSNQLGRWMLLDPLHAALVVDSAGEPLSTWDAHAVAVGSGDGDARRKWLAPEDEVARPPDDEYFPLFRLPAISLRSNLARQTQPWTIKERREQFLALRDDSNADLRPGYYQQESDRGADFNGARNLCRMELEAGDEGPVLRLDNLGTAVHFWKFQLRLDDGDWRDTGWKAPVPDGVASVECRTVNKLGVRGVVTRFDFAD